ncbi:MAG: hypothetical protein JO086_14850 [Acidimicrobiia bacterium]|nr:hypothetical protein [Acidimicrobiia bacterium]
MDPNASPAALAHQGCQAYRSGVAPVVENAVASDDLAPALRVQMGLPADVHDPGGVSLSAPFVVANAALGDAGSGDPKYRPIDDALNTLSDAITQANPSGDLSPIGSADALVNARVCRCSSSCT